MRPANIKPMRTLTYLRAAGQRYVIADLSLVATNKEQPVDAKPMRI